MPDTQHDSVNQVYFCMACAASLARYAAAGPANPVISKLQAFNVCRTALWKTVRLPGRDRWCQGVEYTLAQGLIME